MSVLGRIIKQLNTCDGSILDLMLAVGLDPKRHLAGGDWRECRFDGLDLSNLNFRDARLYKARFAGANLAGTSFACADIVAADFEGADVASADFTETDISKSMLHRARNWRDALLTPRQLELLSSRTRGYAATQVSPAGPTSTEDVWRYVALMKEANDFEGAETVFNRMIDAGIKPNAHVFTTLLDKARDFDLARALMDKAQTHDVLPDEAMANALMSNAHSFEQAMTAFETYRREVGFSTTYPFNTVIRKARDLMHALSIVEMMVEGRVRPDAITISAALNTRWTRNQALFPKAANLVRAAVGWGVQLREPDFAALLRRAQSEDEVRQALQLAAKSGITHGAHIQNALIARASSFSNALALFHEMGDRSIKPDRYTFHALVGPAKAPTELLEALALMREAGFDYDAKMVGRVVKKAPDVNRARNLVHQIEASGEGRTEIVRGLAIIWLAGKNVRSWLDRLVPEPSGINRGKWTPRARKPRDLRSDDA